MNWKRILMESDEDWDDYRRYLLDLREDSLEIKRNGLAQALECLGVPADNLIQNLGVMQLTFDATEEYNRAVDSLRSAEGFECLASKGWVPSFCLDDGQGDCGPNYVIQFLDVSVEPFNAKPPKEPDMDEFLKDFRTAQEFSGEIKMSDVDETHKSALKMVNALLECKVGDTVRVTQEDGSFRLATLVNPSELKPDVEAMDGDLDTKGKFTVKYLDDTFDVVEKDAVVKIEIPDMDDLEAEAEVPELKIPKIPDTKVPKK